MITEQQIHHLATSTPLSYDGIAALSDRAKRYGMSDAAFLVLVEVACAMSMDNRGIAGAIDAGIGAWRKGKEGSSDERTE